MIRYSVIIPAYNAKKTMALCLDALLKQSVDRAEYEVIVVDDGSADETSEIAAKFPVKCIRQANRGPASARNLGTREAKAEIILFTDSDCVPQENWIEEMVKPLSDPEVIAVKGAYRNGARSLMSRFVQLEFEERFELLKRVPSIDMVDTYSAAFRKDVFLGQGGFDESFPVANNEDTDLSYKLSKLGRRMVFNPDAVVSHLNHPDSLRMYARLKFWRAYWRMVVYRNFPAKAFKDSYTPQTLKLQTGLVLGSLFLLPFCALSRTVLWSFMVLSAAFFISTLPFFFFALKRDRIVALESPLYILLRAASLGTGILFFLFEKTVQRRRK